MPTKTLLFVVLVLLGVGLFNQTAYRVLETEKAILLEFGNLVDASIEPGLHFKLPVAEEVKKFDARVLTLDSKGETYYTIEKKPLIVDSFVKWRVADIEKFYTGTSFDERRAERLLQERTNEGLRNQISRRDMHEVISGQRDELMNDLRKDLDRVMRESVGVEVVDVRVKKIDLPSEVSSTVYERMNSEREIEARQYRAEGQEKALAIRAKADRDAVVLEAEAYRESEQLRGDGDAKAANVYASAYNKDPEFYSFYRSINAYSEVFNNKSDLLVLDPSSDFFKYLQSGDGKNR
ncbi:MAG: protease modulator HflC [Gammaproteobacteria bacterium]|jgi:membrane protease subunit HflC|nr:protease modulator HflC [Gammaproteobacteria bacterium]MDA8868608.1 protease modulator HflC [Pseudomonadales bacterium]MBT3695525.1 protease modulator HflC [Gammaproteobacteria bacterium]MBT5333824.1 protease modulator HflC [Gammaproteobacteria bacterium]MBT5683301.1 protease modulator HflC [Gammaproteobacteria bacterium]